MKKAPEPPTVQTALARRMTKGERIDWITEMMARGDWVRGKSGPIVAVELGVAPATIDDDAAEAWRRVCREAKDIDHVTENITTALQRTLAKAEAAGQHANVAKVADIYSRVVGARAPERHEHAVVIAQFNALSGDEKIRQLEATIAELQGAVKALRAGK